MLGFSEGSRDGAVVSVSILSYIRRCDGVGKELVRISPRNAERAFTSSSFHMWFYA